MSRRRSRWTYAYADGIETPRCILAYSEDDVRSYFERRNKPLAYVIKGDQREAALTRKARIQKRNRAIQSQGQRFVVDQRALLAACKQFGITRPVKIRLHGRVGSCNGNHSFENTHHNVMLKWYRSPEEANETLWHELTHCKQAEECLARGGNPHYYFRKQHDDYTYNRRPIEIEARRVARAHQHIMLLRAI